MWEQSPLKYADRVKTPTMFIHSDQDYRCWIAEPIQMFYALKLHGVETRFLLSLIHILADIDLNVMGMAELDQLFRSRKLRRQRHQKMCIRDRPGMTPNIFFTAPLATV